MEFEGKDYYDILGISKEASEYDIKKAYKKQALKHHPDRNPNNKEEAEEKFKKISNVYKVLTTPELKSRYDKFGEDGLQEGQMSGGDPSEMFSNLQDMFFGGFGRGRTNQKSYNKGPNREIILTINLKNLYLGKSSKIKLTKKIKCNNCNGTGGEGESSIINCNTCQGKGKIIRIQQSGPFMQQIIQECYKCQSKGKIIKPGSECKKCKGQKYLNQTKEVDIYVKAGMKHNDTIVLKGEGDWVPGCDEAGDLILKINHTESDSPFVRDGNHLIYKKKINLYESLCGFEFIIKHFDDKMLSVKVDKIIQSNMVMKIKNEGMPINDSLGQYGHLYVKFTVVFPDKLSEERKKYLRKILPRPHTEIWDITKDSMTQQEKENLECISLDYLNTKEYEYITNNKSNPVFHNNYYILNKANVSSEENGEEDSYMDYNSNNGVNDNENNDLLNQTQDHQNIECQTQ